MLELTQLDQQRFIGMNAHTTSLGAGGTLGLQGTLVTGLFVP
ncbi:hypothetical protein [Ktedonobacter sp. SOSP1-52]